ncbi:uncharacterized protein K452DRAFT_198222, partial [Aplosporella prunicola CBS 121167]
LKTMDGKDSIGRRISLLNDDVSAPPHRLPSLEPAIRSRTSSYASSPCLSPTPRTPQLLRSNSTDSNAMTSPSPITPTYDFADSQSPKMAQMPYFLHKESQLMHYAHHPLIGQAYPSLPAQQVFIRAPGAERQPMPPANPKTKKNQYPCPLAKQFNCSDYFTTSGHAARHAKKHTGKKDAICPDCRKAFTRKDNMEQHRRTHQNGRNARNASKDADESRAKKQRTSLSRPKPSPIQSSDPATMSLVDPSLPISPASSFGGIAPAVQPADDYMSHAYAIDPNMSYPPPERYQLNPPNPSTYGLETLALACGEKRKFEA